jgi:hypothetical protein
LRPRELSLMADAAALAHYAAGIIATAWRNGAGAEAATLAGERAARGAAAQDLRTLVSFDGGRSLVPFQGDFAARPDPFVAYLAVKMAGFWAELFVTAATRPSTLRARAHAGLAAALAALAALAPGVEGGAVFAAACAALGTTSIRCWETASAAASACRSQRAARSPVPVGTRSRQAASMRFTSARSRPAAARSPRPWSRSAPAACACCAGRTKSKPRAVRRGRN